MDSDKTEKNTNQRKIFIEFPLTYNEVIQRRQSVIEACQIVGVKRQRE